MKSQSPHHHHDDINNRLKRAEGHLRSIIQMIKDERPCVEIAQQLHAVEKAVSQAKRTLIQDHIDHCLESTLGESTQNPESYKKTIAEFKEITKYL
jgi:DNA-binding FrmR family transcriptional regulator